SCVHVALRSFPPQRATHQQADALRLDDPLRWPGRRVAGVVEPPLQPLPQPAGRERARHTAQPPGGRGQSAGPQVLLGGGGASRRVHPVDRLQGSRDPGPADAGGDDREHRQRDRGTDRAEPHQQQHLAVHAVPSQTSILTSRDIHTVPTTTSTIPAASMAMPSGSVNRGRRYSRRNSSMNAPATSGSATRIHAEIRPSADSARTWRRSAWRSRIVFTVVVSTSARLPPTSCWTRTATTAQDRSVLRIRTATRSSASSRLAPSLVSPSARPNSVETGSGISRAIASTACDSEKP